ncbi:unnamed protein product [Orchesella dallaii]|uniref:DEP domain-containing protein n=2 Tax=Orchesella dallaii TaxID=48710 RepID=A0ABP1RXJ6_9HEXA
MASVLNDTIEQAMAGGLDSGVDATEMGIDHLYPAVIECFAVILLGYIAGKSGIITQSETKGLNAFIGTFSLPALIFLSLAQLDLTTVNWWFLVAICLAKSVVFFAVIIISLLVSKPAKLDKAGLFAIFCTQSNDFALGYPIIMALYGKTHPEYGKYIYLVAPVNLILLNPIAFVMMEIAKQKSVENEEMQNQRIGFNYERPGFSVVMKRVMKGVLLNPIIIMTALGICGNLAFSHCVPSTLHGVLDLLGSAFSASSLFSLGLTMVGSSASLKGSGVVIPGILIATKLMVLPVVMREFVTLVNAGSDANETMSLSNYGFLYGTFPVAPGVFVYANHYDVAVQLMASAMVACTILSAPLMFVSAKMITLTKLNPGDYVSDLDTFLLNMSIIGLIAAAWVIGVFMLSRKWQKVPHCITLCLAISQAIACFGAILWSWIGVTDGIRWKLYLQFGVFAFGVLSSRIWTAILAASLVFLRCRSLCFVLKLRPYMGLIGWGIPGVLITVLMLAVRRETLDDKQDPNFQYGETQALVAVMVLVISFIVTVGCLIMQQRYERQYGQYNTVPSHPIGGSDEEITRPILIDDSRSSGLSSHMLDTPRLRTHSRFNQESQISISEDGLEAGPSCKPKPCMSEIEDLKHNEFEGDGDDESLFSYNDDLCAPGKQSCTLEQRKKCTALLEKYRSRSQLTEPEEIGIVRDRDDEFQMLRHIILLLLLCGSMFVGIALCLWTLIMEDVSGIYVELVFLDAALNLGQGFFTFMLFGLNTKTMIMPIQKWWRRLVYGEGALKLPAWDEISNETKQICEQFLTYHVDKCIQDIVRDRRWRMESYSQVFCGNEMVDWLLLVGLAKDRAEAIKYGRHLLTGRVIRHIKNLHHFHDQSFFYTFTPMD